MPGPSAAPSAAQAEAARVGGPTAVATAEAPPRRTPGLAPVLPFPDAPTTSRVDADRRRSSVHVGAAPAPTAASQAEIDRILSAPEPAPWQQLLLAPVATKGRAIAVAVVLAVIVCTVLVSRAIDNMKPEDNPGGLLVIDTSSGRPMAVPNLPGEFAPPGAFADPQPDAPMVREPKTERLLQAETNLQVIVVALRAYAADHGFLPAELSLDLAELAPYAEVSRLLRPFEEETIDEVDLSTDAITGVQTLTLWATPIGHDSSLEVEVHWPQN